jgi:ribosomal-protein-alanine N-acetyltransferase
MTTRDLDAVRRIERAAYPDAWSRRVFEQELRNAFARYLVATPLPQPAGEGGRSLLPRLIARGTPRRRVLVGFIGMWFMVDQLHIATIAVDPPFHGDGIGARLLLESFALAREAELATVALEVRVSNARALALYQRYGFTTVGRQRGYYEDNGEDALVMLTPDLGGAFRERVDELTAQHRARYPGLWVG